MADRLADSRVRCWSKGETGVSGVWVCDRVVHITIYRSGDGLLWTFTEPQSGEVNIQR